MTSEHTIICGAMHSPEITCDFLAFRLDEREFAIQLDKVCELSSKHYAFRCDTEREFDDCFLGHTSSGVPVFDLHGILRLPSVTPNYTHHVIVVRTGNRVFGLAVDRVVDVATLAVDRFMLVEEVAAAADALKTQAASLSGMVSVFRLGNRTDAPARVASITPLPHKVTKTAKIAVLRPDLKNRGNTPAIAKT